MEVRDKLARRRALNLAEIGRSLQPPAARSTVSRVFAGEIPSRRIRQAIEEKLEQILIPGNDYGWWPGKQQ